MVHEGLVIRTADGCPSGINNSFIMFGIYQIISYDKTYLKHYHLMQVFFIELQFFYASYAAKLRDKT